MEKKEAKTYQKRAHKKMLELSEKFSWNEERYLRIWDDSQLNFEEIGKNHEENGVETK